MRVRLGLVKHKIVRILRPGATINQHQLSGVQQYNFRKNISNIHSLSFSQIVTGSNTTCTARYSQMSRQVSVSNKTKCEKKSPSSGAMCSRAIFLLLRCHGYDATKVVLIKFGFPWTNICFYFTEQRRSFQS